LLDGSWHLKGSECLCLKSQQSSSWNVQPEGKGNTVFRKIGNLSSDAIVSDHWRH
jgi:hypothetical protein